MSLLSIYKASAGSGKTYQLTLSYLILLFKKPDAYRRILAVTYTNKAAREMKTRILDRLYHLSKLKVGEPSEDLDLIVGRTGLSIDAVILKASMLLTRVLNDYSRMSISTIDKFFQGIIRSFTMELGLAPGYTLELDQERILSEAIDMLFNGIADDPALHSWILQLAENRIEENRSWKFEDDISSLGKELFKERFQELLPDDEAAVSREKIDQLLRKVNADMNAAESEIRKEASDAITAMHKSGFSSDDFKGKSVGPAAFIEKLAEKGIPVFTSAKTASLYQEEKWLNKGDTEDVLKNEMVTNVLMPALRNIYDISIGLNTATSIKKHIYALGIISDITAHIRELANLKNLFLISDSARFLRGLTINNPTPFIYEKTGIYTDHIMLDEFQDTSVFQWENFKPLLNHTLSEGNENLVVGDVKQSIYRWRNSDWKILGEMVEKEFSEFDPEAIPLDVNWRSLEHVVEFNNLLFRHAPEVAWSTVEDEIQQNGVPGELASTWHARLTNAYADVKQSIPKEKNRSGGFVCAEVLAFEKQDVFKEQAMERLEQWIKMLQDAGYGPGDIAIIVRKNSEGQEIAKILMELSERYQQSDYDFSFVSNESLFLSQHPSVKFLLYLLQFLDEPENPHNNVHLVYFHRLLKVGAEAACEAIHPGYKLGDELGQEFIDMIPKLKRLSLFEITEFLIVHFGQNQQKNNLPYIQAFQEVVLDVQQSDTGSIHDFLNYWSEFGDKKTISVSEMQNAITITTIHKSKGLQFEAVILPFVSWKMTRNNPGNRAGILWCDTTNTTYSQIAAVPLSYSKSMAETLFAGDYVEELVLDCIDNLNLLYVASTRAKEAMFMGLHRSGRSDSVRLVGELVEVSLMKSLTDGTALRVEDEEHRKVFYSGQLKRKNNETVHHEDSPKPIQYPVFPRHDNMKLRLKGQQFEDIDQLKRAPVKYGTLMHEILGLVAYAEDLQPVINSFLRRGVFRRPDAEKIHAMLREKIMGESVKDWYTEKYRVLRERDFISDGKTFRPDRVMVSGKDAIVVDYKFGEVDLIRHQRQVQLYMSLMQETGYADVRGFIWYVPENNIIQVTL